MTESVVDPALFRRDVFEVEWLDPLTTPDVVRAPLEQVLLVEAARWLELGTAVGYFPQPPGAETLPENVLAPTAAPLAQWIRSQPLPTGLDAASFDRALSDAREDLSEPRRALLRLVAFASDDEWSEAHDDLIAFAAQMGPQPSTSLTGLLERVAWALEGSLSDDGDDLNPLDLAMPAAWRRGSLTGLASVTTTAAQRLACVREARDRIAQSMTPHPVALIEETVARWGPVSAASDRLAAQLKQAHPELEPKVKVIATATGTSVVTEDLDEGSMLELVPPAAMSEVPVWVHLARGRVEIPELRFEPATAQIVRWAIEKVQRGLSIRIPQTLLSPALADERHSTAVAGGRRGDGGLELRIEPSASGVVTGVIDADVNMGGVADLSWRSDDRTGRLLIALFRQGDRRLGIAQLPIDAVKGLHGIELLTHAGLQSVPDLDVMLVRRSRAASLTSEPTREQWRLLLAGIRGAPELEALVDDEP